MSIRIVTKRKAEENSKLLKDWPAESCEHEALCPFRQTPVLEKKKCQLMDPITPGVTKEWLFRMDFMAWTTFGKLPLFCQQAIGSFKKPCITCGSKPNFSTHMLSL